MQKESLGLYMKERLQSSFEHYTNPEYGDNPDVEELLNTLRVNTISEVIQALREFENEAKKLL